MPHGAVCSAFLGVTKPLGEIQFSVSPQDYGIDAGRLHAKGRLHGLIVIPGLLARSSLKRLPFF